MVPAHVGPRPVYDSDVVYIIFYIFESFIVNDNYANQRDIDFIYLGGSWPEIPTDPIVERLHLVEEENNYLKEKIKRIKEEKMLLELHVGDVVNDNQIRWMQCAWRLERLENM